MELTGDLSELVALLEDEGVLLMPTDTIWGLCCDATNEVAIRRVARIKKLPPGEGMISLVADLEMLKRWTGPLHPRLETLLALHKRPLTVIYPDVERLPDLLSDVRGGWAIRITRDPRLTALIRRLGRPLLASAACVSGDPPPAHFGMISSDILQQVDYIATWGRLNTEPGSPSTLVAFSNQEELIFLRE
jgi:L-threonylcarbamoyladenylate synthase